MSSGTRDPMHDETALERAERQLKEQDRKLLHLKTLYDTSRELSQLSDPAHVLDTFLLMTMGPLGVPLGFAQLFNLSGGNPLLSARGLSDEAEATLVGEADTAVEVLFGPTCDNVPGRVEVITTGLDAYPFLPEGTLTLVRWCGPDEYAGLIGLGRSLSGEGRGPEEEEFISRLSGILISSLRHALAARTIENLYGDLSSKNVELESTLGRVEAMQRELDRRMFQLNSLYEATQDLACVVETRGLLDTFLLTVMGVFGARDGGIFLHGEDQPTLVLRGAGAVPESVEALEGVRDGLEAFFIDDGGGAGAEPMSATVLTGEKQLAGASFPFQAKVAVAFAVDAETRGLMALGERLDGEPYRMNDQKLLQAHVGNVLSYIENARNFGEITALNADLVKRNEELNDLINEISACKVELSDVEMARERILSVIRRETSRSGRVRRMDFALILLLSLVIGLVFNFSNPAGVSMMPDSWKREPVPVIDAGWLRLKVENKAVTVVDARPAELYRKAHLRGAVNMPRSLFEFVYAMRFATLDPESPVVVYGRTFSSHYDEDVAAMLRDRGFSNVSILSGGLPEWEDKGFPMER